MSVNNQLPVLKASNPIWTGRGWSGPNFFW